jgi:hypothetical protein
VDRRAKVEPFEQIRREYEHGGGTIRGIAKKLGIHRRMVREAVLSAVPIERKTPVRERPKLEPAMAFIDALLEADRKAPRKQRHTAHRIWCRIREEMPEVNAMLERLHEILAKLAELSDWAVQDRHRFNSCCYRSHLGKALHRSPPSSSHPPDAPHSQSCDESWGMNHQANRGER